MLRQCMFGCVSFEQRGWELFRSAGGQIGWKNSHGRISSPIARSWRGSIETDFIYEIRRRCCIQKPKNTKSSEFTEKWIYDDTKIDSKFYANNFLSSFLSFRPNSKEQNKLPMCIFVLISFIIKISFSRFTWHLMKLQSKKLNKKLVYITFRIDWCIMWPLLVN